MLSRAPIKPRSSWRAAASHDLSPSWSGAEPAGPLLRGAAWGGSTTTRSSWRTTPATSSAARRASGRALLHLHQLLPAAGGSRLPAGEQPLAGADHLDGEAGDRAGGPAALAGRRADAWSSTGRATAARFVNLDEARRRLPETPIADEALGTAMLYSSGTTGRPKGIIRPLPEQPPASGLPLFDFLTKLWRYREGMIYLSPAPLYHSAPQAGVKPDHPRRRHGGDHGALRRRRQFLALVEKHRSPTAAGADHVLAHAEAAGGGAPRATTSPRWRSRSTPPRPARSRSSGR